MYDPNESESYPVKNQASCKPLESLITCSEVGIVGGDQKSSEPARQMEITNFDQTAQ